MGWTGAASRAAARSEMTGAMAGVLAGTGTTGAGLPVVTGIGAAATGAAVGIEDAAEAEARLAAIWDRPPGSGHAVVDDLVEGFGQARVAIEFGKAALLGEGAEQNDTEIVDVAGDGRVGFGWRKVSWLVADTVAAQLYGVAGGEDVGRLDVLVDEVGGVQSLDGGDEAGGQLAGLSSRLSGRSRRISARLMSVGSMTA